MLTTLIAILAAISLLIALLWFGARRLERPLLYQPDPRNRTPEEFGLTGIELLRIPAATPDTELNAWHQVAAPDQPTLVYFHGNAGHLGDRAERFAAFATVGVGVIMIAYRGYSGSDGQPSERANIADASAALDWLIAKQISARPFVLYGESLGTGIAIALAASASDTQRKHLGGLILDAPYTSIADVGALAFPMLPVHAVMRDTYRSNDRAPRVTLPTLIVHGSEDAIVPVAMGRTIAERLGGPTTFQEIAGAGHMDHYPLGSFDQIRRFIINHSVATDRSSRDNNEKPRAS